jgi:hypothetical protein
MTERSISLVPQGQITIWVSKIWRYLKKSEAWTGRRATVDDIVKFIYTGQMQLWVIYDPETMKTYGEIITEIKQYPQCSMLVCQYAAGEPNNMKQFEDKCMETICNFAKSAGCAGVEWIGRIGWRGVARRHGFVARTMVFEKYFSEEE